MIFGGETNKDNCYIAPTLIEENTMDSLVMKDEIFGPILPILTYEKESEIDAILSKYEKPLALYIFTENHAFSKKIIQKYL